MITRKQISRLFYIYSEASVAVMLGFFSIIELACYFAVPEFFQPLALGGAVVLAFMTISLAVYIYNCEKKWSE